MVTRRHFIKISAATAAGLVLPLDGGVARTAAPHAHAHTRALGLPGGTQDPAGIPKYRMPLIIPPAMPPTQRLPQFDFYQIAVRQFQQQILPAGMPKTTVWSYGSASSSGIFNYPAFTIEATANRPVRIKWINDLIDRKTGKYLPHLLPVDP